ncbi:restriction endonuclease subunit S [Bacillus weihaiensis]|uniref:restriction endonuclease subunit S n=1 Tax=Bacillus weihaiensis TaxID=1547283 RepID=UPI002357B77B|nr:restriction endonuclease subunit S [Bacillus weihaiensis]
MDVIEFRNSVIESAIRGKLTMNMPKRTHDIDKFILRIKEEKQSFLTKNNINKKINIRKLELSEPSFGIPNDWVWLRMEDITNIGYFKSVSSNQIPKKSWVLELKDLEKDTGKLLNFVVSEDLDIKSDKVIVKKGDVLYSKLRPYLRKIIVAPYDGFATTEMFPLTLFGDIIPEYVELYLKSNTFLSIVESGSKGDMPRTNATKFKSYPIALPSFEEQREIINVVKKIFAFSELVDKRQKLDERLKQDLKSSILDMAIHGKLVAQDPNEEPVSVLLERIKEEKEQLIKDKVIIREKALAPITQDEIPFDLPDSWKWVRLGDIAKLIMGQSPPGNSVTEDMSGIEFHQGKTNFGKIYLKKSKSFTTKGNKIALPNAVLLSVRAPVGSVNITEREICIGRGLCAIESLAGIDSKFYFYFIRAFEKELISSGTGTTFSAVTAEVVKNLILPLPPLAEQKRIIKKIEKILKLTTN